MIKFVLKSVVSFLLAVALCTFFGVWDGRFWLGAYVSIFVIFMVPLGRKKKRM